MEAGTGDIEQLKTENEIICLTSAWVREVPPLPTFHWPVLITLPSQKVKGLRSPVCHVPGRRGETVIEESQQCPPRSSERLAWILKVVLTLHSMRYVTIFFPLKTYKGFQYLPLLNPDTKQGV